MGLLIEDCTGRGEPVTVSNIRQGQLNIAAQYWGEWHISNGRMDDQRL
jgi:hypothetical protein